VPALLRGHSDLLVVGSRLSDSGETVAAALASGACGAWADGTRFVRSTGRRGDGRAVYGEVGGGQVGAGERASTREAERERKNKEAACDGEGRGVGVLVGWVYISLPAGVRAAVTSGSDWLRKSRERPVQGGTQQVTPDMQGRAAAAAAAVPQLAAVELSQRSSSIYSMALQQQELREN
jgi:hypothetical protein